MINEVIANHVPKDWEQAEYTSRRYHLYELGQGDSEYNQVASKFQAMRIERVCRLQNPFMYGRFLLRQEHLRAKCESVHVVSGYHPICKADAAKVAEYNCDYRRYSRDTIPSHYQCSGKKAKFYRAPNQIPVYANMSIVVVKVISSSNYVPAEIIKDWDTEYYPAYIVDLEE